ncbi:glycine/D-amino acid oxidase-like deaminating enzyme [Hasllibacter halocynthiae]|uniref:Glycine/D-amino acid oxidase-like deaminating enzyme n=1 Tax=Hasllibacter halocynthiae TaxID=595589 RepID=A0A2T0X3B4_9RHOB|nr:FAD-binding oxidoreductase [Hasllibacter halocynthiae]PRY93395.1 glycine/D-amino acid oxidase-like deaminating enzyme [Hasllibacter halocynthiae]
MVDLVVRGAGVIGLACAWTALRRGARVAITEPRGVASGASGGVVGALSPHAPERWTPAKALQLRALVAARGFWPEVEDASGISTGYARAGRLQPLVDEAAVRRARDRAEGALRHWGTAATWEVVSAPEGWGPASATGLVLRDTLAAHLHPRRACSALAAAIRAAGGTIGPEAAPAGAPVIEATGWEGLREHDLGAGQKGQGALLGFDARGEPQIYTGGIHVIPHLDGTTGIGSTSEGEWTDAAPDAAVDAVIARARVAVPALADAPVIERWGAIRPRARTREPVIGRLPSGAVIANGGFKIGFGIAPEVARLAVDLALEGRDDVPDGMRPGPAAPLPPDPHRGSVRP